MNATRNTAGTLGVLAALSIALIATACSGGGGGGGDPCDRVNPITGVGVCVTPKINRDGSHGLPVVGVTEGERLSCASFPNTTPPVGSGRYTYVKYPDARELAVVCDEDGPIGSPRFLGPHDPRNGLWVLAERPQMVVIYVLASPEQDPNVGRENLIGVVDTMEVSIPVRPRE